MNFDNPEEMIRANGAAEAAEQERLRRDIVDYQRMLGEMKDLYLKNNELVTQMQDTMRQFTGELPSPAQIEAALAESEKEAADMAESDGMNEGARIVNEKLNEIEAKRSGSPAESNGGEILAAIEKTEQTLEELLHASEELSHKDSVRVYRNVQASLIEELEKQTKTLSASIYALREGQTTVEAELRAAREAAEAAAEACSGRSGVRFPVRNTVIGVLTFVLALITCVFSVGGAFGLTEQVLRMMGL
ncbi:hypothetical protein [Lachnoclostridium sp. Marseille-P6806]|uniref:hypothetical protein n=1 Tax=Lachnoclostridium sp. Marseille-P6806 TaxID=2364793 RepID=UPI001030FEDE|nr:hypothetical protein [Lachnoclostridium sp. Marseille-P6806]